MMRFAALVAASTLAVPGAAGDLTLSLPVDCILGETCHIQNYVDRDAGPGARDFLCGPLSYDRHKGTDFALPTLADMRRGVTVRAAAAGIVAGTRDGMADRRFTHEDAGSLAGRDCGNGVVLIHEEHWETQYCHMMRGSVLVKPGQRVERGTPLGQIGLSGRSQFPHLHITVRHDGAVVDPFDAGPTDACETGAGGIWTTPIAYQPGGLLSAGFADAVPAYDVIRDGTAARPELPGDAPALVLFGFAFGGRPGDVIAIGIAAPDGAPLLHRKVTLEKTQARFFRAAGLRRREAAWPPGVYRGTVTILRDGAELSRHAAEVVIE